MREVSSFELAMLQTVHHKNSGAVHNCYLVKLKEYWKIEKFGKRLMKIREDVKES